MHKNENIETIEINTTTAHKQLCSSWNWMLLISGVFLVLLGTLALSSIIFTTLSAVIVFGIILIAAGIVQFVQVWWSHGAKEFFLMLLLSVLSVAAGIVTLANPELSLISFTLILGVYFLASGLFKTIIALVSNYDHWGWLFLSGIVTLILGILVIVQWPASSLWLIGTLLAIDFIFIGWYYIMLFFLLRTRYCPTITQNSPDNKK